MLLKTTLKIKVWLLENKSTARNKKSSFQETVSYFRRPGEDYNPSVGPVSAPWCEQAEHCQSKMTSSSTLVWTCLTKPTDFMTVAWVSDIFWWVLSLPSTVKPICHRKQELSGPLLPWFLPWAHVTDVKGRSCGNGMLPAASFSMTGLGQWWSGEAYPRTHRPLQALQPHTDCNSALGWNPWTAVRPHMVHWSWVPPGVWQYPAWEQFIKRWAAAQDFCTGLDPESHLWVEITKHWGLYRCCRWALRGHLNVKFYHY